MRSCCCFGTNSWISSSNLYRITVLYRRKSSTHLCFIRWRFLRNTDSWFKTRSRNCCWNSRSYSRPHRKRNIRFKQNWVFYPWWRGRNAWYGIYWRHRKYFPKRKSRKQNSFVQCNNARTNLKNRWKIHGRLWSCWRRRRNWRTIINWPKILGSSWKWKNRSPCASYRHCWWFLRISFYTNKNGCRYSFKSSWWTRLWSSCIARRYCSNSAWKNLSSF